MTEIEQPQPTEQVESPPWAEERRNRMAGELSFWRIKRSWIYAELVKADQKIRELTADLAETGELNYIYGKTDSPIDLMVKKPKLFERIRDRISGSIRR